MGTLIFAFGDWVCVTLETAQLKASILRCRPFGVVLPLVLIIFAICGRGSLVIKVTDSWPACHEFKPGTTEDPPCRGGRCTLNMPRLKHPHIGLEVRRGGAGSGVILFLDYGY
ncbi:hypothetical protein TNCV_4468751 [Trichonephila clavipes]|nr:hypothetical protein TNCV_4468751 [Trichonephila clavipes]